MPTAPTLDLHVTLRWRDDVLAFRRIHGDGAAAVGAHPEALAPIPCSPAFAKGMVFARLRAGAAEAVAPAGSMATVRRAAGGVELFEGPAAVPLGAGDTAELSCGEFRFSATADVPEALPRGRRRGGAAWGALALAALAHVVVLGLAAQDALAHSAADREDEREETLRGLMASAEMRARANLETVEDGSGSGDGRAVNGKNGDGRAGGGVKAAGEQGAMGDRLGRAGPPKHYAVEQVSKKENDPSVARAQAVSDAEQFGMIGLLAQGASGPVAPFADTFAHGADALAANGAMWGNQPGVWGGYEGLGLTGIGEGGGGVGEGIGLGRIGRFGHTDGSAGWGTGGRGSRPASGSGWSGGRGWLIGHHTVRGPVCHFGYCSISGRLPPEAIQRVVRQNFGRFRACYEDGLRPSPNLQGRVTVRFVIGRDGSVMTADDGGSDLPDRSVVACVVRAFSGVSFPQPEGGIVTVTYPITFAPG